MVTEKKMSNEFQSLNLDGGQPEIVMDPFHEYPIFKPVRFFIIFIGRQNSGKSLLSNFLFGCDFSTSEGRCTRGFYKLGQKIPCQWG